MVMKRNYRRMALSALASGLALGLLGGCGGGGSASSAQATGEAGEPAPAPYLEVWKELSNTQIGIEKDGPYSKFLQKESGVGIFMPFVPWDGGNTYVQKLNTRIASGEIPDMFLPWQGNEVTLAKQGAIADLTDLLPKYAPNVWNRVPKEVWDVVRSSDPSGKGRIYYIPKVQDYTYYGSFIRQDWLDRVGLKVPATKDEYVAALRAFKEKDANGNGDPNDEIPVSGREQGRWMDHLFGMYGVAMIEGIPAWDMYDGKLQYAAVTPNMKAAIEFMRGLYAEKLLDSNTFLNKNEDWTAKIQSDKVGNWYHLSTSQKARAEVIAKVNKEVSIAALGIPKVEGYNGFITKTQINRPEWVISSKNEAKIISALKLLNWANDPKNAEKVILGVEGMHYELKDGKPVLLPVDPAKQEALIIKSTVEDIESIRAGEKIEMNSASEAQKPLVAMRDKIMDDMQKYGKRIAGDGIPASIYDGFSDIKNNSIYQEYMTKMIIGDYPMSKFEEFVDKWNKNGGSEVTKRAQEWYAKTKGGK